MAWLDTGMDEQMRLKLIIFVCKFWIFNFLFNGDGLTKLKNNYQGNWMEERQNLF